MTKTINEPTLSACHSGSTSSETTAPDKPATMSTTADVNSTAANCVLENPHQAWCKTPAAAADTPQVAGSFDSETAFVEILPSADQLLAEERALWTCPGSPRTHQNAGLTHYPVCAVIDHNPTMVCFFCRRDMGFLPARNMPKRKTYHIRC